ncbi:uncharacterized protein LOC120265953 isoform X1 [Dioscorea cayenensis subsp. rotundata]|uniref:Uncharacterized protein LOC120265953 isoform X1 n=1 Tax=Dioscorea cayennensis subsp. rotundata TaxID=55577 RepID=A0AB40BT08_DIOCR|nr:uncharacterized protein LOC120265953 isoform X1 [Dioscorea cayenensis subsp. rotundata]
MNSISAKLFNSHLHFLCTAKSAPLSTSRVRVSPKATKVSNLQLKEKWLDSLSLSPLGGDEGVICASEPQWVLGVDPDVSGAVALLKPDGSVSLAQGWWSGGYTYGLWIGVLVASGFSVVPVTSHEWKNHYELSRSSSSKPTSPPSSSAQRRARSKTPPSPPSSPAQRRPRRHHHHPLKDAPAQRRPRRHHHHHPLKDAPAQRRQARNLNARILSDLRNNRPLRPLVLSHFLLLLEGRTPLEPRGDEPRGEAPHPVEA